MKIPIIYEKEVKTVADIVKELLKLDQSTEVENDFPEEDSPPALTIRRDEHTGKINIKLDLI